MRVPALRRHSTASVFWYLIAEKRGPNSLEKETAVAVPYDQQTQRERKTHHTHTV